MVGGEVVVWLVAFLVLPTVVDRAGNDHGGMWVASAGGWLALFWLVPCAAVAVVVWRSRVGVVAVVTAVCTVGYVVALLVFSHPAGEAAVYEAGVDPAVGIGWGLPIVVGTMVVVLVRCARRLRNPYGGGAVAGVALGTAVAVVLLVVRHEDDRVSAVLLAAESNTAVDAAHGDKAAGDEPRLYTGVLGSSKCGPLPSDDLTAVVLRWDTRVTAFGAYGSSPYPYAAVLQAGTSVLVDQHGVPKIRCGDGTRLDRPTGVPERFRGTPWPGFAADHTVEVTPAPTAITSFTLAGREQINRPSGTAGERDWLDKPDSAILNGQYSLSGTLTTCNLSDCSGLQTFTRGLKVSGCPNACLVTVVDWPSPSRLSVAGGTWSATGTPDRPYRCQGVDTHTAAAITFTVKSGKVVNGQWNADRVEGDYRIYTDIPDACTDANVIWHFTGTLD